ncbi:MAG TPA: ester cyclase [Candidatus Eisenbacteria bacterium]|nr:ester cyclase [Candidatus Eisenbacteria bacterium]
MTAEQNSELVRRTFAEAFNRGDLRVIDESVGIGVDHQHPDEASVSDHLKHVITAMRRAFPDLHFEINQMIAEGEWVSCHSFMTGTHDGELRAPLLPRNGPQMIPATGHQVNVAHMHLIRIVDGKTVELWHVMDTLTMLGQLGLLPGRSAAQAATGARS